MLHADQKTIHGKYTFSNRKGILAISMHAPVVNSMSCRIVARCLGRTCYFRIQLVSNVNDSGMSFFWGMELPQQIHDCV